MQDDNRGFHGVTPPQLLHKVVEALLSTAYDHMVAQLLDLVSASDLANRTVSSAAVT